MVLPSPAIFVAFIGDREFDRAPDHLEKGSNFAAVGSVSDRVPVSGLVGVRRVPPYWSRALRL